MKEQKTKTKNPADVLMSLSPRKMFVLTGGGPENYLGGAHTVLEVNCSFLFLFIPFIIMIFF